MVALDSLPFLEKEAEARMKAGVKPDPTQTIAEGTGEARQQAAQIARTNARQRTRFMSKLIARDSSTFPLVTLATNARERKAFWLAPHMRMLGIAGGFHVRCSRVRLFSAYHRQKRQAVADATRRYAGHHSPHTQR